MEPGLVSVIVPALNRERFLGDAVRSVLQQSYSDLEVVIVDDGSTDGTYEVAQICASSDNRVRVLRTPNRGPASARNAGLHAATGEYVSFLDSDDVYTQQKVESHVHHFGERPEIDLVFSDYATADERLNVRVVHAKGMPAAGFRETLAIRNWFATTACTVRRSLIERVGPFRTDLRGPEDWELWIRCARAGTFSYVPGVVTLYRQHGDQFHDDYARLRSNWQTVIDTQLSTSPGERRLAIAAVYWNDAMYSRLHRRHGRMSVAMIRFAVTARRPSRMQHIVRTINL